MYYRKLFVVLGLIIQHTIYAQSISGVVNDYTAVTAVGCNYVAVVSPAAFSVGDRVLIIQMQGAMVANPNNSTFGSITAYNNAGNYEFATISSIVGLTINFQFGLVKTYTPGPQGHVQLIRVPQYTNATVVGAVSAAPWNGITGGVVVMEISGTLTMNARIDVSGQGFRGGSQCTNPDGGCGSGYTDYSYPVSSGFGAEKGEGIAVPVVANGGGRGAWANGGGGGNKHNSGGGGGSNFSVGGHGGNQANFCPVVPMGGTGGYALTYNNKIFMGGGGGCSDNNNSVGTIGGDGGGIVIIRAGTLAGNNDSILANGESVGIIVNGIGDGAGGGGAGGTVLLDVGTYSSNVNVKASGGDGGDQNTAYSSCFGPGGGGGVGVVWVSQSSMPGSVNVITLPGTAGIDLNASSSCYLQSYGATPGGSATGQLFNLVIAEGTVPAPSVNLGNDSSFCSNTVVLNAGNPGASYLWSTGATTQTITVGNGTFWVTVTSASGCVATDTITFTGGPIVALGQDTVICGPGQVVLATFAGYSYQWNTGDTSNSITVSTSGTYSVVVTDSQGCTGSDVISVTFAPVPIVDLGNDSTYCVGGVLLNAGNPGATYLWSTGATSQTLTVSTGGIFWVTVSYGSGCTAADTISFISNGPVVALGPDTVICGNGSLTLNAGSGGTTYQWNTGANTSTINVSTSGTYSVLVTNALGCTGNDTISVQFQAPPQVTLPPDIVECNGQPALLFASGATSYAWSTGAIGSTITVSGSGVYWVAGSTGTCTDRDTILVSIDDVSMNLGGSIITCDSIVMLSSGVTGAGMLWSTGEITESIVVNATGSYTVTATTANCNNTEVVDVEFLEGAGDPPVYPNIFTPNEDGINDVFVPLNYFRGSVHMQIFDRWGQLVFEAEGVNPAWNGKTPDGKNVSEGVYYWIANYQSGCQVQQIESQTGFVTILRYRE